jgi:hypothetical protein
MEAAARRETVNTTTLLAWAKSRALPVTSCVTARLRPDHLIGEASREELLALVVVLAEAADPVKLRAVVTATDEGPHLTDRDWQLRAAHTEATRLRRANLRVPAALQRLEREYWSGRKNAAKGERAA